MKSALGDLLQESYILWNSNRIPEARACCERALEIDPNHSFATMNLAACYGAEEGLTPRVRALFQKAYDLDPDNISVMMNIAAIALDDCEYEKCMEWHDKILAIHPLNSEILDSKGRLLLTIGKIKEGFELCEHGLGLPDARGRLQPFSKAAWRGDYCNKLLITNEQGFGDTIQMVRYAQHCKTKANKVYLLAAPELKRLIETCPWLDGVVQRIAESEFEEHISVMSLAHIFRTDMDTIPATIPYLYARKSLVDANPIKSDKPKVGLCWSGNPRKHSVRASLVDRKRSVTFGHFKKFLEPKRDIQFYNLQFNAHENRKSETNSGFDGAIEGDLLLDPMRSVHDFAETAAIIAQLDLVVTVDTSIAHVAGAMGKPVWILSRFSGCWRWLTGRSDSPWYPTARLFRQPAADDWESVIAQVNLALDLWRQDQ